MRPQRFRLLAMGRFVRSFSWPSGLLIKHIPLQLYLEVVHPFLDTFARDLPGQLGVWGQESFFGKLELVSNEASSPLA